MRLRDYIKQNRAAIDSHINARLNVVPASASCNCPRSGTNHTHNDNPRRNDSEREQWVLSDESLYLDARAAGCRI